MGIPCTIFAFCLQVYNDSIQKQAVNIVKVGDNRIHLRVFMRMIKSMYEVLCTIPATYLVLNTY